VKVARTVAALLAVTAAGSADDPWQRPIAVSRPGKVVVTLDRDVYDKARSDLGDLRIVDDTGADVPYLVERGVSERGPAVRRPVTINRGFVRGRSATATLDFGAPTFKSELLLSLPGDNFRRRVVVEGRSDTDRAWTTLTDSAYVFAVPGPPQARYETVPLPENDYRWLRVTVLSGPDDPERLDVRDVWIRPEDRPRPREVSLTRARVFHAEDAKARETVLTIDLAARFQPILALVLDVASERFFRDVVVEARRDLPAGAAAEPFWWTQLGTGVVYRYEEAGRVHERLRIDVPARERMLRLRIHNRDDQPLAVRAVTVLAPLERVVFEAAPFRRYSLQYGVPERSAPSYDVARTVRDPAAWIAESAEGALGEPSRLPPRATLVPWTERHPALLWVGLVASVAALGLLTWRALRAA
jgi:hypothetical protein